MGSWKLAKWSDVSLENFKLSPANAVDPVPKVVISGRIQMRFEIEVCG
jgi:hypothetical protein